MRLVCPSCRNLIEVTESDPVEEICCPSCGSSFRLERRATTAWEPSGGRRQLGRFELLDVAGEGAFGTVYRARDPNLGRVVAIKVPRSAGLAGAGTLDRFLREARSAAQLRHPCIVTVHEVGQADGLPFLVSDFVQGVTLADRLTARRPTFRESAEMVAAVAEALAYAHGQGVVHRDVKPSNILLDAKGRPLLTDFGLARRDAGEVTVTVDGQVLGTPAYMSPEQARGEAHQVDGRSDVYSLGAVFYQLLTGELPFRGNTRMLLHQVLHDEPRPPRALNDRVPRDLETVCLKAMAKEPHRRYPSARDLADDLRRWLGGEQVRARPARAWERGWRWVRRRPAAAALLLAGGVASLALVALAVLALSNRRLEDAYHAEAEARDDAEEARGRAEESRKAEVLQRQRAEAARGAEEQQRHQAETARGQAEKARKAEAEARKREQAAAARAALFHYFHRIALAQAEWRAGNVPRAEQLLDEYTEGHRRWEWHYLKGLCHGELLTLPAHTKRVTAVAFSPDGKRFASAALDQVAHVWDAATGKRLFTLEGHTRE